MSIFSKIFKKRQQPIPIDKFKVVLKTEMKLSEEQKNAIITIVRDGIGQGTDLSTIAMAIIVRMNISSPIVLNRIKNGVEVIIW